MISSEASQDRITLPRTRLRTKTLRLTLLLALVAILGFYVNRFWVATIDDAFISLRYSVHWAQGLGLTFNVGERVEGYSNFLWVAMMAVASRIGLDVVVAAKVVGLLSLLTLIWLSFRALVSAGYGQFAAGVGMGLLLVSNAALVFLAVTGLETVFFAALLMAILDRLRAPKNRMTLVSAILLMMLALTRPEGIAYCLALAPVLWWLRRGQNHRLPALWLVVMLVYGGFLIWRWNYFRALWPNTFYAKPSLIHWFGGLGVLASTWTALPEFARLVGSAGGPIAAVFAARAATSSRTREHFLPFSAVILTGSAFQLYAGSDWMNLGRFLMPVVAPFVVLALVGWRDVSQRFSPRWQMGGLALWIGLTTLFNLSAGSQFWAEREAYPNFVLTSEDMISASQWIGAHYPSDYSIVCWRIGALGFYSNLRVIDDQWGITDTYIASLRHANELTDETRDAYLAERNPELVIKQGLSDVSPPGEITVGGRQYLFVRRFPQGSDEWWDLYERSNLPAPLLR